MEMERAITVQPPFCSISCLESWDRRKCGLSIQPLPSNAFHGQDAAGYPRLDWAREALMAQAEVQYQPRKLAAVYLMNAKPDVWLEWMK